jgi:hypothetical protein
MLETKEAWARLLRGQRHIGDFTRWKEHDAYSKALERLLRDLRVETAGQSPRIIRGGSYRVSGWSGRGWCRGAR